MKVVLHQSPMSMFPNEWLDGMTYDAPDYFRPMPGDQVRLSQVKAGSVSPVMIFVVSVAWAMTYRAGNQLDCEMHLAVASEMPPKTGTRRVHDNRKK